MAGSSSSVSQNQSTSQSTTGVLDYPERPFLDAIAQYAGTVGQNVYNWAQGEYAKNSSLTDANVHNYLNASAGALGQANNYQNTYRNTALPAAQNILREGQNYASKSRQLNDMGAAESGQLQGNEAALANHKRDLQSYGVDPSAGRYAGLDEAARVSGAAAAVGAAQQARNFDITTGQNLQERGLNALDSTTGTFQGATTNATNTALQGFAGAENAGLANANTGVALQGAANPFLSTAASYKPITGTNSSSQSTGSSQSTSNTSDPAGSSKSDPKNQQQQGGGGSASDPAYAAGQGSSTGSGSQEDQVTPSVADGGGGSVFDTGTTGYNDYGLGDAGNPYNSAYPTSDIGGGYDPASQSSLDSYSGGGFGDYYPQSGGSGDYSGVSDSGGGGASEYAEGGAIPDDGGEVPESASPSRGAVTDDVSAQLPSGKPINVNAHEFVIPEDVARWKGEEYFQKLIMASRQARVMSPARPTQGRAPMGQAHGI